MSPSAYLFYMTLSIHMHENCQTLYRIQLCFSNCFWPLFIARNIFYITAQRITGKKGQKKSSSWAVELWYFSVLSYKTIQIKYKQIMHKCKQIMQIVHNLFIKCFLKDILNYSVEASWRCVGILDPRIQLKSPLTASVSLDILCLVVVGNVSYKELWCSSS